MGSAEGRGHGVTAGVSLSPSRRGAGGPEPDARAAGGYEHPRGVFRPGTGGFGQPRLNWFHRGGLSAPQSPQGLAAARGGSGALHTGEGGSRVTRPRKRRPKAQRDRVPKAASR